MSHMPLFDWLATKRENSRKTEAQPKPPPPLSWTIKDSRPVFRLSGTAWLARNSTKPFRQRTFLAKVRNRDQWGGLVYPAEPFNASYAFGDNTQVNTDNIRLAKEAGIDLPAGLSALELDLSLDYARAGDAFQASLRGVTYKPLIRPQFSTVLPIPGEKLDFRCIASGTTRQALVSLSAALASGQLPLVLITGPPGSGKEAYAAALHYGRSQNWDEAGSPSAKAKQGYRPISLASLDTHEFSTSLNKILVDLKDEGGTVFFDEADKAGYEVRASLLRLLEIKRYQTPGGGPLIDCEKISFVVGAGARLGRLRKKRPPDFWTRMEVHIEVGDPLAAPSGDERETLIAEFFRHFWWDAVSRWLEGVLGGGSSSDWDVFFEEHPDAEYFAGRVFNLAVGVEGTDGILTPSSFTGWLADLFAKVLAPHLERRELSVRGLRSAVKSIAWDLGHVLLARAMAGPDWPEIEMESRKAVFRSVGTVIQVLPD